MITDMVKTRPKDRVNRIEFMTTLKRHRVARGLTQTQLAKRVGVMQSTYSFWERGQFMPEPYNIPKLARALGIDAFELTKLIDPPVQSTSGAGSR